MGTGLVGGADDGWLFRVDGEVSGKVNHFQERPWQGQQVRRLLWGAARGGWVERHIHVCISERVKHTLNVSPVLYAYAVS